MAAYEAIGFSVRSKHTQRIYQAVTKKGFHGLSGG
jgi:hypothetical protein